MKITISPEASQENKNKTCYHKARVQALENILLNKNQTPCIIQY